LLLNHRILLPSQETCFAIRYTVVLVACNSVFIVGSSMSVFIYLALPFTIKISFLIIHSFSHFVYERISYLVAFFNFSRFDLLWISILFLSHRFHSEFVFNLVIYYKYLLLVNSIIYIFSLFRSIVSIINNYIYLFFNHIIF
jgi:hypothetical protein